MATYCMIPTICHYRKCKTMERVKKKSLVGKGWGEASDKKAEHRGFLEQ